MKIQTFAIAAISAVVMTACGGGGDDGQTNNNPNNTGNVNGNPPGNVAGDNTANVFYPTELQTSSYTADKKDAYDLINGWRKTCGFNTLAQNTKLDQAAQAHADYLINEMPSTSHSEVYGKAGYTGDNALDRANAAGYEAIKTTEVIAGGLAGSFFTGTSTPIKVSLTPVDAKENTRRLFASVYHMNGLFDELTDIGIGAGTTGNYSTDGLTEKFFNTTSITLANRKGQQNVSIDAVSDFRTFPCNGITNVMPVFYPETPNPFGTYNLENNPKGHPILVQAPYGTTIIVNNFSMAKSSDNSNIPVTQVVDAHAQLTTNKTFFVPDSPLEDNTKYKVSYNATAGGKTATHTFEFTTSTQ